MNIKAWAEADRPREKLLIKGKNSLSDAELLAILIGSGNKEETAVGLSQRILNSVKNNLNELGKLSVKKLTGNFKGIGEAKAITIIAALELGRRRKLSGIIEKPQIRSSRDAFEYLSPFLSDLPHEEFWVIFLNTANKVISHHKISQGGLNTTTVDVRVIARKALEDNAQAAFISHNHPSGSKKPGQKDLELTNKIKQALNLLDIKLLDHIIVADNSYLSFADEGFL